MSKKKGPTQKDKTNFSNVLFKNVNNPLCVLLTISLKGLLIKTARINDVKPSNLNTTTTAKEEVMPTILIQGGIKQL